MGKMGDTWRGMETRTKTGETDQGVTESSHAVSQSRPAENRKLSFHNPDLMTLTPHSITTPGIANPVAGQQLGLQAFAKSHLMFDILLHYKDLITQAIRCTHFNNY
jgi:hypothetical protein